MSADQWAILAAIALPFVGGLHRFAVSYGYRGLDRREAFREAVMTALGLAAFSALYGLIRLGHQ